MSWEFQYTQRAQRDLRNLDRAVAQRITSVIRRYAETGHGDLLKLQGSANQWRLRVGDWRVRVTFDHERYLMIILRVLHRSEAYRD